MQAQMAAARNIAITAILRAGFIKWGSVPCARLARWKWVSRAGRTTTSRREARQLTWHGGNATNQAGIA
jgi:3-mercaptopyruvate sulfurtransferase SseA